MAALYDVFKNSLDADPSSESVTAESAYWNLVKAHYARRGPKFQSISLEDFEKSIRHECGNHRTCPTAMGHKYLSAVMAPYHEIAPAECTAI